MKLAGSLLLVMSLTTDRAAGPGHADFDWFRVSPFSTP